MKSKNIILTIAETLVIGGIIFAFISPLFSPSEENNTQESSSSQKSLLNILLDPSKKWIA